MFWQNAGTQECLAAIYDQITKPLPCSNEFPDDHAYQTKSDVDFHNAENQGNRRGENDLLKLFPLGAAKGADQLSLLRVHLPEAGVEI